MPVPRITALTFSNTKGASSRYRVYQFVGNVERSGMELQIVPRAPRPSSGLGRILASFKEKRFILDMVKASDLVWIQKRLYPERFIDKIAAQRKIIFDFDDAIWTTEHGGRTRITNRKTQLRLQHVWTRASLVVAGNEYLADAARVFNPNTIVIPTVVDLDRYQVRQACDSSTFTLGWIGHSANFRYLEFLGDVLRRTRACRPIQLLVVADRDFAFEGVQVENRRWSAEAECSLLLDMDVGVMPLSDDEWTRGKCALKVIQYMAAGLPVIASDVGANREVIRHGVDGYLARSAEQWSALIAGLVDDAEARKRMGTCGRARVQDLYSLQSVAPRLVSAIQGLLQ